MLDFRGFYVKVVLLARSGVRKMRTNLKSKRPTGGKL